MALALKATDVPPPLPRRQMQIGLLLASGVGYKQISFALGIADKTVKHHAIRAYRKAHVNNARELALWLLHRGYAEIVET